MMAAMVAPSARPIGEKDLQGPFLKRLPAKMEEMKDIDWLGYTSPVEALAENFHMSEALLKASFHLAS